MEGVEKRLIEIRVGLCEHDIKWLYFGDASESEKETEMDFIRVRQRKRNNQKLDIPKKRDANVPSFSCVQSSAAPIDIIAYVAPADTDRDSEWE